jgi:hypothetical protein
MHSLAFLIWLSYRLNDSQSIEVKEMKVIFSDDVNRYLEWQVEHY